MFSLQHDPIRPDPATIPDSMVFHKVFPKFVLVLAAECCNFCVKAQIASTGFRRSKELPI